MIQICYRARGFIRSFMRVVACADVSRKNKEAEEIREGCNHLRRSQRPTTVGCIQRCVLLNGKKQKARPKGVNLKVR